MSFRYAGFWARAIAESIDVLVLVAVSTLLELAGLAAVYVFRTGFAHEERSFTNAFDPSALQLSISGIFIACAFTYFSLAHYRGGRSLGKRIFGLRVANSDGTALTLQQSVQRTLASAFSLAIFGAGYWLAAVHPQKRTLHDLIAGTIVIKSD